MKALPSLAGRRDSANSPARNSSTSASSATSGAAVAAGATGTASAASPLISSTAPPASEDPSPTDLLLATPPALLKLFALSAPIINLAATLALLVTWKHPSFWGSLLVLLAWWATCLFGYGVAKYGLNAAVLAFILVDYLSTARRGAGSLAHPATSLRHRPRPATLSPAAYSQLLASAQVVAEHVQAFRTSVVHPLSLHFSFTPLRPATRAPAYDTAWFLVTSYPFYLAVTYIVPLKYLFLTAGTVALLWQAPFFATLRAILWRSAAVRWACHLALALLRGGYGVRTEWNRTRSGLGLPGWIGALTRKASSSIAATAEAVAAEERPVKVQRARTSSGSLPATPGAAAVSGVAAAPEVPSKGERELAQTAAGPTAAAGAVGDDVEVQFTVFENQRWWVGLDWTQALLPGERASWTDADNNPANPPAAFVLPQPSVVYVPAPTKADPGLRLRKTTEWRWIEPEWHVLRSAASTVTLPGGVAGQASPVDGSAAVSPGAGSGAGASASPPSPTLGRILGVNVPSLSGATSQASNTADSHPPSSGSGSPPPPQPPQSAFSALASSLSLTSTPSYTTPSSAGLAWHESNLFATWQVDDEGWQYGDNHFEKMGPRGGLGKYTRRRAWVRRAGLVERTERVPGPMAAAGGGGGAGTSGATAGAARRTSLEEKRKSGSAAAASAVEVILKEGAAGGAGTTAAGTGTGTASRSSEAARRRRSAAGSGS